MKTKELPVGIFDSGMGGLSVLKEVAALLPHEHYIFYGDNRNAPYGTRDEETIRKLSLACAEFLDGKHVKMMVVACNTATSIVVQTMRKLYELPVVSMEPAVKPPADKYEEGTIAVFATPATLKQKRYKALVERLGIGSRVRNIPCDGLATLIEERDPDGPEVRAYVRSRLRKLRGEENVCALVLGCTHYSFVRKVFSEQAGEILNGACEVFDGNAGTARHIRRVLAERDLLNPSRRAGSVDLYTSGDENTLARMTRLLSI